MLHFITDAPTFLVREIMALAHGWCENVMTLENELIAQGLDELPFPGWAETLIHVGDVDAAKVLMAFGSFRIERAAQAPRPAIGDPTFALAAAAIERETNGSPSSAAFAR